jgi:hypothetical protein
MSDLDVWLIAPKVYSHSSLVWIPPVNPMLQGRTELDSRKQFVFFIVITRGVPLCSSA